MGHTLAEYGLLGDFGESLLDKAPQLLFCGSHGRGHGDNGCFNRCITAKKKKKIEWLRWDYESTEHM